MPLAVLRFGMPLACPYIGTVLALARRLLGLPVPPQSPYIGTVLALARRLLVRDFMPMGRWHSACVAHRRRTLQSRKILTLYVHRAILECARRPLPCRHRSRCAFAHLPRGPPLT